MKFWATMTDIGIVVRGAESRDQLSDADWQEVEDIANHANRIGIDALRAGKRMVFTQCDQSYPALAALFAD